MLSEGLDVITALSKGKVFRMIGDGERAFERIARELSGYYRLGFAPEPGDRDGEVHDVRVKVEKKGVEVRSRRVVRIPRPGERRDDDEVRLARVASSPMLATELPLSAATYVTRNPESGRLRLLVSASTGDEGLPTSPAAVAILLRDGEGNIVASGFREATDAIPEARGPDRFLGAEYRREPIVEVDGESGREDVVGYPTARFGDREDLSELESIDLEELRFPAVQFRQPLGLNARF